MYVHSSPIYIYMRAHGCICGYSIRHGMPSNVSGAKIRQKYVTLIVFNTAIRETTDYFRESLLKCLSDTLVRAWRYAVGRSFPGHR